MAKDKFYVYRPILDMLGFSEGTAAHDGYNETLGYGAYTGGDVELTTMSLKGIDVLQTQMLAHPKNHFNSSAVGMYQIVRTTLREIKKKLNISDTATFNEEMQDRMACFLLGKRGIDRYLAGKMPENELILELAKEWASLPTPSNRGYYDGQHARVDVDYVRDVLAEVRARHVIRGTGTGPDVAEPAPSVPSTPPVASQAGFPFWLIIPAGLLVGAGVLIAQILD